MTRHVRSLASVLAATAVLVGAWWAWTTLGSVRPLVFPSPQAVLAAVVAGRDYLTPHLLVTAVEAVLGYLVAVLAGVAGGMLLATSRAASQGVMPLLFAFDALPKLAFAPMLIIWLGWGAAPKVVMAALMGLLAVVFSTVAGLQKTPADAIELARSLAASRWQAFVKIRLPYALPRIFVGVKLAAPLAVVGAVVGEFFAAAEGLGYIVRTAGTDTPLAFCALLLLAALSWSLLGAAVAAERLLVPWAAHIHH